MKINEYFPTTFESNKNIKYIPWSNRNVYPVKPNTLMFELFYNTKSVANNTN